MKYFIGYLLAEKASEWHVSTAREISDHFHTWRIHEKLPPHVTLFYPFDTEQIEDCKKFLRAWCETHQVPGNLTISDFDHFDDRVVFAKVETTKEVERFVNDFIQEFGDRFHLPSIASDGQSYAWHPHSTLANKLTSEEINKIWEYVQTIAKPDFLLPLDNLTLFASQGDGKWTVEETFYMK